MPTPCLWVVCLSTLESDTRGIPQCLVRAGSSVITSLSGNLGEGINAGSLVPFVGGSSLATPDIKAGASATEGMPIDCLRPEDRNGTLAVS